MVMSARCFSIITPSSGRRPKALALAMSSVETAQRRAHEAGFDVQVEMLVGFDGLRPDAFVPTPFVRHVVFPFEGRFGNAIRHGLIKNAKGDYLLFVDDDNALSPTALLAYMQAKDADLIIGRIDTSRAFKEPFLPCERVGGELVVQGNIDPLCLCVRTDLVRIRCGGWDSHGGYESDYLNILKYYRRARKVVFLQDIVGVYDAGRGLDDDGLNARQVRTEGVLRAGQGLPSASPWRTHG
jgi:hypothetical protein